MCNVVSPRPLHRDFSIPMACGQDLHLGFHKPESHKLVPLAEVDLNMQVYVFSGRTLICSLWIHLTPLNAVHLRFQMRKQYFRQVPRG